MRATLRPSVAPPAGADPLPRRAVRRAARARRGARRRDRLPFTFPNHAGPSPFTASTSSGRRKGWRARCATMACARFSPTPGQPHELRDARAVQVDPLVGPERLLRRERRRRRRGGSAAMAPAQDRAAHGRTSTVSSRCGAAPRSPTAAGGLAPARGPAACSCRWGARRAGSSAPSRFVNATPDSGPPGVARRLVSRPDGVHRERRPLRRFVVRSLMVSPFRSGALAARDGAGEQRAVPRRNPARSRRRGTERGFRARPSGRGRTFAPAASSASATRAASQRAVSTKDGPSWMRFRPRSVGRREHARGERPVPAALADERRARRRGAPARRRPRPSRARAAAPRRARDGVRVRAVAVDGIEPGEPEQIVHERATARAAHVPAEPELDVARGRGAGAEVTRSAQARSSASQRARASASRPVSAPSATVFSRIPNRLWGTGRSTTGNPAAASLRASGSCTPSVAMTRSGSTARTASISAET